MGRTPGAEGASPSERRLALLLMGEEVAIDQCDRRIDAVDASRSTTRD